MVEQASSAGLESFDVDSEVQHKDINVEPKLYFTSIHRFED